MLDTEKMAINKAETREYSSWRKWRINKQINKKVIRYMDR